GRTDGSIRHRAYRQKNRLRPKGRPQMPFGTKITNSIGDRLKPLLVSLLANRVTGADFRAKGFAGERVRDSPYA
ncbi:hypothetical protein NKG95_33530, partial [Mesorhizobium sp. M1423]